MKRKNILKKLKKKRFWTFVFGISLGLCPLSIVEIVLIGNKVFVTHL